MAKYRSINNAKATTMSLRDFLAISKALGDENRVRMLLGLREQELCLCQIVELVQLAPSTVSKHMSILRQARLVNGRKDGRWQYYRLADASDPPAVRQAIAWVQKSLADDPQIAADAKRLLRILKLDPQRLCESQCAKACTSNASRRKASQR
jgi:ArsR family transcriptional regulator, arsenate/arsenite/antimonite-responsive transcriptional repressor